MRKAINSNTILLVASAPAYPHGVLDPVEEIAALAKVQQLRVLVNINASRNIIYLYMLTRVLVGLFFHGLNNLVTQFPSLILEWMVLPLSLLMFTNMDLLQRVHQSFFIRMLISASTSTLLTLNGQVVSLYLQPC
jgi:hypothetical protein